MGVPPAAASASAVAAPRPDAPPVTITRPIGRSRTAARSVISSTAMRAHFLDEPGRGTTGEIREENRVATPPCDDVSLRERARGVVGTLREHIGAQPLEYRGRSVFVEHLHRVDALEREQDLGPVRLGLAGALGSFEATHRAVGIEQDYEIVTEPA